MQQLLKTTIDGPAVVEEGDEGDDEDDAPSATQSTDTTAAAIARAADLSAAMKPDTLSLADSGRVPSPTSASKTARSFPPRWAHVPLSAPSVRVGGGGARSAAHTTRAAERRLLEGLRLALSDGWSGSYGALAPTLATKLAAEVMPSMMRVAIPEGATWQQEGDGEWLLLVETSAAALVDAKSGGSARNSRESLDLPISPGAPGGGFGAPHASSGDNLWPPGEVAMPRPQVECVLSAASVLWDGLHPPPPPRGSTSRRGSDGDAAAANAKRAPLPRWHKLYNAHGKGPAIVRCIARASLRGIMITLREALARSHAAQLAQIPLFAPLDPSELVALCRRATEVAFPADAPIQPMGGIGVGGISHERANAGIATAGAAAISRATIPSDAFALVLSGHVLMTIGSTEASNLPNAASPDGDVALALAAAGLETLATPSEAEGRVHLPERIPLARLGTGRVLGETGRLIAPSSVSAHAGGDGLLLLVWRREASVLSALSKLPLLLPSSWQAKVPLAILARAPRLAAALWPLTLPQLQELPATWRASTAAVTVILSGELIEVDQVRALSRPRPPPRPHSSPEALS